VSYVTVCIQVNSSGLAYNDGEYNTSTVSETRVYAVTRDMEGERMFCCGNPGNICNFTVIDIIGEKNSENSEKAPAPPLLVVG